MNTQQLTHIERLAWLIEADGAAAHNPELAEIAALAHRSGLRSSVVDVLADIHAPAAVRERAYGYVAVRLARLAHSTGSFAYAA